MKRLQSVSALHAKLIVYYYSASALRQQYERDCQAILSAKDKLKHRPLNTIIIKDLVRTRQILYVPQFS